MASKGFLCHAMFCAGLIVTTACGPAGGDAAPPAQRQIEPDAALPAIESPAFEAQEETLSGELGQVDLEAQTFTVMLEGEEYLFAFTEDTEVTGAADAQGLAGRAGSPITVTYRGAAGPPLLATKIDLR